MMRVGLNATCFNDRASGARQRFNGIYGELVRLRRDVEFVVFEPSDCRVATWFDGAPNVVARRTPVPSEGRLNKTIGGLAFWPSVANDGSIDLFEGFNLPFTRSRRAPNVLTIHDLRRLSRDWALVERLLYVPTLRRALDGADHVFAVSHTMREKILEFHPKARVSVVYNGIDVPSFATAAPEEATVLAGHRLPGEFVLAVGHLEERKNYARLIDALGLLKARGRPIGLVIVGNDSGLRSSIDERISRAGLDHDVLILSGLSDAEVRALYSRCALFVFPSVYEGFGIPLLESMAAGKAMAVSDIDVFREIADGCASFFDPTDVGHMADTIDAGLSSSSDRERLVASGRAHVESFGFPALARQVSDVYDRLAG